MTVGILSTGHANVKSLSNTIERLGYSVAEISNADEMRKIDKLILPGVGAFPAVMAELANRDMVDALKEFAKVKPMLGICLGMQLMLASSSEHGFSLGLSLINGTVEKLPNNLGPVPHVGWNELICEDDCSLMFGIQKYANAYFVHSYHCIVDDEINIIYTDFYGEKVVAGFQKKNIFGAQFHPEKSQNIGEIILRNFLEYENA